MNEPHSRSVLVDQLRQPPQHLIDFAIESSTLSPCRSKRGSVIFRGVDLVSHGYNFKPRGFDCDGSAECKKTCRIEAIHAEQMALLLAGASKASGAEMLHVKTVNGHLVPSGGPSCAQCSKLALVSGIRAMWLYHDTGWRRYETAEWHRLSLIGSLPQTPETWQPIATCPREVTRAILYWPKVALTEDLEQPDTPVFIGGGLVAEGFRVGGNSWENDIITEHFEDEAGFGYFDPTHWMPLPAAPQAPGPETT